MNLKIPELSLVTLVGASGSGKSSFARKHFKPTEVVSSDFCRGLVSDDENDQSASPDAFDLLHYLVRKRLARGLLTVVDATNVEPQHRKQLVDLAREYHALPVAIVLNVPARVCTERNALRPDRQFGHHVVRNQQASLRKSLRFLGREGFRYIDDPPEAHVRHTQQPRDRPYRHVSGHRHHQRLEKQRERRGPSLRTYV